MSYVMKALAALSGGPAEPEARVTQTAGDVRRPGPGRGAVRRALRRGAVTLAELFVGTRHTPPVLVRVGPCLAPTLLAQAFTLRPFIPTTDTLDPIQTIGVGAAHQTLSVILVVVVAWRARTVTRSRGAVRGRHQVILAVDVVVVEAVVVHSAELADDCVLRHVPVVSVTAKAVSNQVRSLLQLVRVLGAVVLQVIIAIVIQGAEHACALSLVEAREAHTGQHPHAPLGAARVAGAHHTLPVARAKGPRLARRAH